MMNYTQICQSQMQILINMQIVFINQVSFTFPFNYNDLSQINCHLIYFRQKKPMSFKKSHHNTDLGSTNCCLWGLISPKAPQNRPFRRNSSGLINQRDAWVNQPTVEQNLFDLEQKSKPSSGFKRSISAVGSRRRPEVGSRKDRQSINTTFRRQYEEKPFIFPDNTQGALDQNQRPQTDKQFCSHWVPENAAVAYKNSNIYFQSANMNPKRLASNQFNIHFRKQNAQKTLSFNQKESPRFKFEPQNFKNSQGQRRARLCDQQTLSFTNALPKRVITQKDTLHLETRPWQHAQLLEAQSPFKNIESFVHVKDQSNLKVEKVEREDQQFDSIKTKGKAVESLIFASKDLRKTKKPLKNKFQQVRKQQRFQNLENATVTSEFEEESGSDLHQQKIQESAVFMNFFNPPAELRSRLQLSKHQNNAFI